MTGMQREVPSLGAPRTGVVLEVIRAMVEDGPFDPGLRARLEAPEAVAERDAIAARLRMQGWADQGRYEQDNAAIVASRRRPDIVFMGDSITEIWPHADPDLFREGRVGRGIAGQTTPQMLVRLHADVIALRPRVLHLMGGGNDIVGNTGPTTPRRVRHNLLAMTELARHHDIRVLIGGLTPSKFSRRGAEHAVWVDELNAWLRELSAEHGYTYLDYFAPMCDEHGDMRAELSNDALHPNRRGYAVMRAVLDAAL